MEKRKEAAAFLQIFTIIAGALLMGFLWRVRGDTGWGSSWGLLNAGFVFTLFMILAKGERQKLDMGNLALTALSFMMTVPAWGTLLNQITGVLHAPSADVPGDSYVYVSVWSAVLLMLSLGFGLATVFGIMLGKGYSGKQWELKDYIILVAVFYAVDYAAKASVSHAIMNLIQPEAVDYFEKGLAAAGIDGDAWHVWLQHFDNVSWGKKIEGGRHYFSMIQIISSVFRALGVLLVTRFVIKDKTAAKTGAVVSGAFAFAITISDLFFYFSNGGYHMEQGLSLPSSFYAWSCWEYFTGFIAGAIITAYMLHLKKAADVGDIAFARVPEKAASVLEFVLGFMFMLGVSIVRPVLERFDGSSLQIAATVIAVIVALIFVIILNKKYGFNAKNISMTRLAALLLPVFTAYIGIVYFFVGAKEEINLYAAFSFHNILCIISIILVLVWSLCNKKLFNKKAD